MGTLYGLVQQQAAQLSFVEAFWLMDVIFLCMLPLVRLLRNARDLHPHEKKPTARREKSRQAAQVPTEPELIGTFH